MVVPLAPLRAGPADCNSISVPFSVDQRFVRNLDEDGNLLEGHKVPYRQLIGSLMFAGIGTRAEIAFVVNQLSQFLESPSNEHWLSAKRVLRYLKGSLETGIVYTAGSKPNILTSYSEPNGRRILRHESRFQKCA